MSGAALHLAEIGRFFLIVTLAAAVIGKAAAMAQFAASTEALLRLPHALARPVAASVVAAEASVAILLIAGGAWIRIGAAAAIALFTVFSAAILAALLKGRTVRCNCFGGHGHRISALDLVRNAILIGAGAAVLALGPAHGVPSPVALAAYFGLGLNLFLVTAHLREIRSAVRLEG